jgi:hypothetical protein
MNTHTSVGVGQPPVLVVSYFDGGEMSLVESLIIVSIQKQLYLSLYGTCCNTSHVFILQYLNSVQIIYRSGKLLVRYTKHTHTKKRKNKDY